MRKAKLLYNTLSSLIFQITTIICGFILPRLILKSFGSEVNGLVNSIAQFLGIIAFLELGVGAVVQSSLYKPLAENDYSNVSKIISSANKFFSGLGKILLVYVIVLIAIYPTITSNKFNWTYTATLIIAMSISSFSQYFFGIVNRLLLTADQKGYVQYVVQTISVIVNTFLCYILIGVGVDIQIIKLTTSLIYLSQSFVIHIYIKRNYKLDKKIKYDKEPIKQKWNGIAQHVAAVILDGTDTIVLTVFAALTDVSIYSVYFIVINGIKQLFMSMTNGITSLIGELWAKQEIEELNKVFAWAEWAIHSGTTLVFGLTSVLIIPFICVYTLDINDVDYIQPLFASLMVAANAGHCLRLPYNILILAGGHYKETQTNYIHAAVMNIVISIVAVKYLGLIGVAIGTLVAMVYQTIWMAIYDSRYLIKWPISNFIKQLIIDLSTVIIGCFFSRFIFMHSISYLSWTALAIKATVLWIAIFIIVNLFLQKNKMLTLFKVIKSSIEFHL